MRAGTGSEYEPEFVAGLFDRMSRTYGFLNYVTSFGFAERWRRQCVNSVEDWPADALVLDLMSGMGEAWSGIARRGAGRIIALDLSREMCARAEENRSDYALPIEVRRTDVLEYASPEGPADVIICTFGLKTLSRVQRRRLAELVHTLLRPGGRYGFVEISDPGGWLLRGPYLFYLKWIIPLLGWCFGGDRQAYGMLGRYTEAFGDCAPFADELRHVGLVARQTRFFFGCATGVTGERPPETAT